MRSVSAASGPHALRLINATAVLSALRAAGPSRIADLMQTTGLSRPAVTRAVEVLSGHGWVADADPDATDDEPRRSHLGRPAAMLRFRAEAGHVLGIDVGPHKILAMVADLDGTVVAERRFDAHALSGGEAVLAAILDVTAEVCRRIPAGSLMSATVGTPGLVDPGTGMVSFAPSIPGWARIPIGATLHDRLACPVTVHNDVNLAVLAERWRGSAESAGTLVFLQWGARVGTGIMIDGRLHAGAARAAGELGFLNLDAEPDPQGTPQSTDGEGTARTPTMGPFERQVGAAAIIDLAIAEAERHGDTGLLALMKAAQPHDDATALFEAAAAGSGLAQTIIDTICARLARGLAAVYLVLDPELVVIGGGLSRAGDQLLTAIERHLRPRTLVPPRLALSALGDTAVAIGALRSALDDVDERVLSALSSSD